MLIPASALFKTVPKALKQQNTESRQTSSEQQHDWNKAKGPERHKTTKKTKQTELNVHKETNRADRKKRTEILQLVVDADLWRNDVCSSALDVETDVIPWTDVLPGTWPFCRKKHKSDPNKPTRSGLFWPGSDSPSLEPNLASRLELSTFLVISAREETSKS